MKWYFIVILIFVSPPANMLLIFIFCWCFIWLVFLLLSCKSFLYILDTSFLSDIWCANIVLIFCGLSFHFLFLSSDTQSFEFWWGIIYLFFFLLLLVLLVSYVRINCQIQYHKVLLFFSTKSLIVSPLKLRTLIHFQLILYMVWGKGQTSFLCMWLSSRLITIFWKYCSFFPH